MQVTKMQVKSWLIVLHPTKVMVNITKRND